MNCYHRIWAESRSLSQPYWDLYHKLIGPTNLYFNKKEENNETQNQTPEVRENEDDICHDYEDDCSLVDYDEEEIYDEEEQCNQDYLEFIKVTREHQAERDQLKKIALNKKSDPSEQEVYYKDISQVDTLVEANLVETPTFDAINSSSQVKSEADLIDLYGGQEMYDKIRSLEMDIDGHFKRQCQNLSPNYWPVIPINLKPYLNPLKN